MINSTQLEAQKSIIGQLYLRPTTQHWSYYEQSLLFDLMRRPDFEAELEQLIRFKAMAKYAPRSVQTFLESWDRWLDESRQQAQNQPKTILDKELASIRKECGL